MNRRTFLKGAAAVVGGTIALAHLPLPPAKGEKNHWAKFDPKCEYGNMAFSAPAKGRPSPEIKKKIRELLEDNMKTIVPPKYRHKVVYPERIMDFGWRYTMAWHYKGA
jgi:hypothetical protein